MLDTTQKGQELFDTVDQECTMTALTVMVIIWNMDLDTRFPQASDKIGTWRLQPAKMKIRACGFPSQ